MSLDALSSKRLRRQWEPEEKAWHDDTLEVPWEEVRPALHKSTMFSLKNVFFFSHATAVQSSTISAFCASGRSAIVEAPTGSGKTLAFLIPIMERTVRACEAYVAAQQRPPLTRDILGVILSPSRTLAEQTYVVAKSLAARSPFGIQFALCDGVVEKAQQVVSRLRRSTRGAGTFLVTTPKDLREIHTLLEASAGASAGGEPPSDADDADGAASGDSADSPAAKRRCTDAGRADESRQRHSQRSGLPTTGEGQTVRFFAAEGSRFLVVVDEADLVFNSPEMREIVTEFVAKFCRSSEGRTDATEARGRKRGKKSASGPKRERSHTGADAGGTVACDSLPTDFAFVGATVATSERVHQYAESVCARCGSELELVAAKMSDDFVSQLKNRYLVCEARDFLPVLIQMMNLHASKKHFIFFNNYRALLFIQRLFQQLTQGIRPLLFVKDVFTMYEGMTERARIDQYNKFLTHVSARAAAPARKAEKPLTDAQKRNQVFNGGWKRDGKAPMGTGAILLCTDMAAFGLDVRDVDYVYHFEAPATVQSYVHRVGRVGRMGMKGSSILLLPCLTGSDSGIEKSRERKTTSTRFNTVSNTKNSTHDLQSARVSVDHLSDERRLYISELGTHSALEEYSLPPLAPIQATLRNVISQDERLLKLAKAAAMSMCQPLSNETVCWFSPKLALHALLLD